MLPKIDVPTHEINLISTGKPVRFRPFLVKEQKLFLMASEQTDAKETINVIRQVLRNCILDDIDIDNLPTFDLEYLFMNLRARSVDEVVNLKYKCNNKVPDDEGNEKNCTGVVEYDINILDIKPTIHENHESKIQINDDVGVNMRYPTFEMVQQYETLDENELMSKVLVDCIEYVYDKEQIYYAKDTPKNELEEFVDSLQQKDVEKFRAFFDTIPELKKEISFECPKCKYKEEIMVKGIQNFFV